MDSQQFSMRLFAVSFGWYLFGVCAGAVGMIWLHEQQPKPKPVVTVEQDGASVTARMPQVAQQARDAAPPTDQRVKELRFSLQKLERLKAVHDATLREAATNQGDIRQMVNNLGAN